jgi:hypothetical protein
MPALPPAGTTPASAFLLADLIEQKSPPAILADAIDPVTGEFLSLTKSARLADGFAIEALRVQRATGAAARDVGNRYREITHVEEDAIEQLDSMTREAFAPAELAGVAELSRVQVKKDDGDPSALFVYIDYRDLLAPEASSERRLVFSR